jgi:hypothetical protein
MELSRMSLSIIKMIDNQYGEFIDDECLDMIQIKNICNIYKVKSTNLNSVALNEINFSSPEFKKMPQNKIQTNILTSTEFQKKYSFFIRIIYSSLKMNITIFDITDNIVTMKNNYQLIKSLEVKKKNLISEHVTILKNQHKNSTQQLNFLDYENYLKDYLVKLKIIDKIIELVRKLINNDIVEKTDNLLSLILPYFYTYAKYIEEYN